MDVNYAHTVKINVASAPKNTQNNNNLFKNRRSTSKENLIIIENQGNEIAKDELKNNLKKASHVQDISTENSWTNRKNSIYHLGGNFLEYSKKENIDFLQKILEEETNFNDLSDQLDQVFVQRNIEETICFLVSLISICSGVLYHQLLRSPPSLTDPESLDLAMTVCLLVTTVFNVIYIFSNMNRCLITFKIKKISHDYVEKDTLVSTNKIYGLISEVFLSLVHPNYFMKNYSYTTSQSFYGVSITYQINEILLVFQIITRIIIALRFYICLSEFYGSRAFRVGKMFHFKISRLFAIKAIFDVTPLKFLVFTFVVFISGFAFVFRILEAPNPKENNSFTRITDCYYYTVVTLTGIGYGDITPTTIIARYLAVLVCLIGTVMISFLIYYLINLIKFRKNEERALFETNKKHFLTSIEKVCSEYFEMKYKYLKQKKLFIKESKNQLAKNHEIEILFSQLKNILNEKLKSQRRFKIVMNEFQNLFFSFSEENSINMRLDIWKNCLKKSRSNLDDYELIKEDISMKIHKIKLSLKFENTFDQIHKLE